MTVWRSKAIQLANAFHWSPSELSGLDLDEFAEWFEEAEWLFDEVKKRREAAILAATTGKPLQ
ncbi:GpE family phage tail protein [Phreatobacter sp. HK31-P]